MARIGLQATSVVLALSDAIEDEDSDDRGPAACALVCTGASAASAVPALNEAVKNERWEHRATAAWALVRIGPRATSTDPALIEALEDEDSEVRATAVRVLRGMLILIFAVENTIKGDTTSRWRRPWVLS
jgi:HEAT repeat protein